MRGLFGTLLLAGAAYIHVYNTRAWSDAIYIKQLRYVVGSDPKMLQFATVALLVVIGFAFCLSELERQSQKIGKRKKRR